MRTWVALRVTVVRLGICTGVLIGMVGALIEDDMLVRALWKHI